MRPTTEPGQRHLLNQIVLFSQSLHQAGVPVNPAGLIDLCRSMSLIDIGNRRDFYATARIMLVSSQADIPVFNRVFSEFWYGPQALSDVKPEHLEESDEEDALGKKKQRRQIADSTPRQETPEPHAGPEDSVLGYSPDEALMGKDFEHMSEQEIERARRLIVDLVMLLANYKSRRRIVSRRGSELNLRKMLRHTAYYSQDGMELFYRKRRIKKIKLLLLCDVSGSMERYSRFLIQFIYALRQQLASLDVAVFSTRMTVVTGYLKRQSIDQSLAEVAVNVPDWGGGTDTGNSLREFNDRFSDKMNQRHTIVIVLSDGWDRGDPDLLRNEMQYLHRHIHQLIWLNPLLGDKNYQPLCKGIQAALPFIDHFLPAHNVESFAQLLRHLRTTWR